MHDDGDHEADRSGDPLFGGDVEPGDGCVDLQFDVRSGAAVAARMWGAAEASSVASDGGAASVVRTTRSVTLWDAVNRGL